MHLENHAKMRVVEHYNALIEYLLVASARHEADEGVPRAPFPTLERITELAYILKF